ncbi:MAG: hypothetical protein LBO81_04385 [Clostridiales Family XIII bacterium]|jgi:hypothetical protein|nr:hypothetical protein [Clostridiales Family XIII bacterium]
MNKDNGSNMQGASDGEERFRAALRNAVSGRTQELDFFRGFSEVKPSPDFARRRTKFGKKPYKFAIFASAACVVLLSLAVVAPGARWELFFNGPETAGVPSSEAPAFADSDAKESDYASDVQNAAREADPLPEETPLSGSESLADGAEEKVATHPGSSSAARGFVLYGAGLLVALILFLSARSRGGRFHALYAVAAARVTLGLLAAALFLAGMIVQLL